MLARAPYKSTYIDIVGKCNARCPWCDRGARNLGDLQAPLANTAPVFMPVDVFGQIFEHLLENKLFDREGSLALHNWGEPLIHPNILEIFSVIKNNKYFKGNICFSTNGSRCVELDPERMPKVLAAEFSLPGFSQKSYDFAHGFNFDKIMKNIFTMSKDLSRFKDTSKNLLYHMYKHNLHEMKSAQLFSRKINFFFTPTVAFFNSLEFSQQYHDNTMSEKRLELAKKSLFLYDFDDLKYLRPKNYTCGQFDILTISHDAQLNVGCCSRLNNPNDCKLGDIRELSFEDVVHIKETAISCQECIAKNLDFSVEYSIVYRGAFRNMLISNWCYV